MSAAVVMAAAGVTALVMVSAGMPLTVVVVAEMCIRDSYEGYQTAEIAALTGLREGSVRSRLTRARTRLRQVLKGEYE